MTVEVIEALRIYFPPSYAWAWAPFALTGLVLFSLWILSLNLDYLHWAWACFYAGAVVVPIIRIAKAAWRALAGRR